MEAAMARATWRRLETIHAVAYFAPEFRTAYSEIGLRGFWMGYFAGRAAPMGAVGPDVVAAAFYNFHPAMVRRSIPDAWSHATPDAVLGARHGAADVALRRHVPDAGAAITAVLPMLARAIDRAQEPGPLFAANRDLELPGTSAARLWQAATTLREHRGDGHVAVLTEAGIDGCEAHVLYAATEGVEAAVLRDNRGWSQIDWDAATQRLHERGLLDATAQPSPAGTELRRNIEARTDELAAQPYAALTEDEMRHLINGLDELGEPIAASGEIPFPNPMGLPR
jgi:hypothetical protein